MRKHFRNAVIAFLLLAVAVLILGCASKKKATERSRSDQYSKIKTETESAIKKDLQTENQRVSEYKEQLNEFLRNFEIEPIDPDQEATLEVTPKKNGGFTVVSKNAKAKGSSSEKTHSTTQKDSTAEKTIDKSAQFDKSKTDCRSGMKEKSRKSDVEKTGMSIPLIIGLCLVAISGIVIFAFYKRFGGK